MARLLATAPIARVVGVVLVVDVIETDQVGGRAAAPTRPGMTTTKSAHPILNVNPMSFPSARLRIVRETPLPPQMHS
jgi:hypothetical protein